MNARKLLIGSSISLLCNSAFSVGMVNDWTRVIALSVGPVWNDNGNTQTFFLNPKIEKTYAADNNTTALINGEFFYGWQHLINAKFQGQLGFAVATTSDATFSGQIWDEVNQAYNNRVYSYKINHTHVALKGRLVADMEKVLLPYVSGSVGIGFNRSHDFTNAGTMVNSNFAPHTETTFSYTIGLGVQKTINKNWQAGVGYEFADWGQSQLGRTVGQTLSTGLSQSHTYTNGMLFSLSYVG